MTDVDVPAPPTRETRERFVRLLEPLASLTQPVFHGIERLPDHGALFVGNHTILGLLDLPFMLQELWKRDVVVRGLGEHAHYKVPIWRDLLASGGMVRGTRANVRALMDRGESVLVFPGGAREVNKRRGEAYTLIWKERLGFARLAIERAYPIVPFAAVGAEEMYKVLLDENNPVYAQVAALVKRVSGVPIFPVVRGIGPTLIPRPQRLYFWFGDPIATDRFAGRTDDDAAARAVRDEVRHAVEGGIAFLLAERETDPRRTLAGRLRSRGAGGR